MSSPDTLHFTVNLKSIPGKPMPDLVLDTASLETERRKQTLIRAIPEGKDEYQVPRNPKGKINRGGLWLYRLGAIEQGTLFEFGFWSCGERVETYGLLAHNNGTIAALSICMELYVADFTTSVYYTKKGEVAHIIPAVQEDVARRFERFMNRTFQAYGEYTVELLHVREYRPNYHDHTPSSLTVLPPSVKALAKKPQRKAS